MAVFGEVVALPSVSGTLRIRRDCVEQRDEQVGDCGVYTSVTERGGIVDDAPSSMCTWGQIALPGPTVALRFLSMAERMLDGIIIEIRLAIPASNTVPDATPYTSAGEMIYVRAYPAQTSVIRR